MKSLIAVGLTQLFRGLRRGESFVAGFGAALALIGWLRRGGVERKQVYGRRLRAGQEVTIRVERGARARLRAR